ncbi:hypothetical protein FXO37_34344 [Capsicum annuum]|nr:hypothetical protein FXO37_34344 [Capsicum annuum]
MDGKTPFRRLTRGIEHVDKINCGTQSFDLGVSQLDSGNAGFLAKLKKDKLKTEMQRKSGNDHVNIRNSLVDCHSKDDLINASKISVVDTSGSKKEKKKTSQLLAIMKEQNVPKLINPKGRVTLLRFNIRLMQAYFDGEEELYKAILFQVFEDKVWGQNDDDSLKIAILYFVHRLIMSDEMHIVPVLRFHFDVVEQERSMNYCWSNMDVNGTPSCLNVPVVREHDVKVNVQFEKPIDDVANTESILKVQNVGIHIEELIDDLKNMDSDHEDVQIKDQSFDPMKVDETKVDCVEDDHSHIDVQHDLQIVAIHTNVSSHSPDQQVMFAASVHMEYPIEIEHPKSIQNKTKTQYNTREYNLASQELTTVEYINEFRLHHGTQKNEIDAVSDEESSNSPVRPQFECETGDVIIIS